MPSKYIILINNEEFPYYEARGQNVLSKVSYKMQYDCKRGQHCIYPQKYTTKYQIFNKSTFL